MTTIALVFMTLITFHNIEEAIFMKQWLKTSNNPLAEKIKVNQFYFAVTIVTLLAYKISILSVITLNKYLIATMYGFMGVMVINAIAPHLIATIYYKKYNPGLITGLVLNIPCFTYIITYSIQHKIILKNELVIATIVVFLATLALLPLLFLTAKRFSSK